MPVDRLPASGGQLNVAWGGRVDRSGIGLAEGGSCQTAPPPSGQPCAGPSGDGTAAGWGDLAGRLRAEELAAGDIPHALFVVLNCDNGPAVWPARKTGRACADTPVNPAAADCVGGKSNPRWAQCPRLSMQDAPPMGTHLWLALPVDCAPGQSCINRLAIPDWKKTILRAMARYGMFFGDTGTQNFFGIETESGNQYLGSGDPWWAFGDAPDYGSGPSRRRWEPFDDNGLATRVGKLYNLETAGGPTRDRRIGVDTIDWQQDVWAYLRVLDPCVAAGTC